MPHHIVGDHPEGERPLAPSEVPAWAAPRLVLKPLQAMDAGGELTVRISDLSQGAGSTLLAAVSDTGCGIPDDMIEQIFNPFVTTKARCTGLGLALSRAIADAHKAILRARNHTRRPDCTFTIEFPVPSAKPAGVSA